MYKIQFSSNHGKWAVVNAETNKIQSLWNTSKEASSVALDLKRHYRLMNFYPKLAKLNTLPIRK